MDFPTTSIWFEYQFINSIPASCGIFFYDIISTFLTFKLYGTILGTIKSPLKVLFCVYWVSDCLMKKCV